MEALLIKAGRIVFGIGMLVFGAAHFTDAEKFAALVPIPGEKYWVYFTGVCLIAAAFSFFSGIKIVTASLLLAAMLLLFVVMVHAPQAASNDELTKANGLAHVFKTLSLAGAALFIAGHYRKKG